MHTQESRPDLITIKAVCAELGGVNQSTVYRMINRGEFPAPIKVGGRALWDRNRIRRRINAMLDATEAA